MAGSLNMGQSGGRWLPYMPGDRDSEDEQEVKAKAGKAGEIARWFNHIFRVKKESIRGFSNLQIKGSTETEDKVGGNQKFVSRKNSKPTEISLTAILNASLGCDVQKEAMQFVAEAYAGNKDWFYIGKAKLATYKLMLTEATVKDVVISPKGKWLSAQVALTLKQCTQKNGSTAGVVEKSSSNDDSDSDDGGGGGGGGGGGSKKKSSKHSAPKIPTPSQYPDSGSQRHASRGSREDAREAAKSAQDEIDKRKKQAQQGRTGGSGGTGSPGASRRDVVQ